MKRDRCLILLVAIVLILTGCGGSRQEAEDGKAQVTIALWGDQLTEQYAQYLRDAFPEVDFTFYIATNSTDFYRFKEAQGDLPDILTVRRFALRDVGEWKDSLMDLSDSQLANRFHQSYLRSYTYEDGTVNWLPAWAEVDSIIVNKTLLEEHGIPVPRDYEDFVAACEDLRELGIRPFASNFSADFTCMEVLQGLSASRLTSQEGREWRQRYESGQTDQLSEEVWLPVFQRMEEFITYAGILPSDMEENINVFDGYTAGESAMVRGIGEEAMRYGTPGRESLLMPYYGVTEEESWYLTYPAFQVAASARAQEDPERRQLILDIMGVMLSEEAQKKISASQNMVPYHTEVSIDLSPAMAAVRPYIDSNHLYIRLASADMFSVSRQVVQGMILGEYPDARSAFDAFNAALREEKTSAPVIAHIETGYSYSFDPERGSPAASAVMNSVREATGTQLLIGPAAHVAGNIASGDYTEAELYFLTMGEGTDTLTCQMTGEQIREYLDYLLTTPGKRGSVINDSALYVASGFEMTVEGTESGYILEKVTVDGREPDPGEIYSVTLIGSLTCMLQDALEAAGVTEYTRLDTGYRQLLVERLAAGEQLAEPTAYITLKRKISGF